MFFGLSVKGAVDQAMVRAMADKPIIFAMANPDPEITPEECARSRPDAIIATGRCDYPNQVNNVLGFPYIFRGALDVRATHDQRRDEDRRRRGAGRLAREDVPDEVAAAYCRRRLRYGPDYIIPAPFDPRLIWLVPSAVAKAAMDQRRRAQADPRHAGLRARAARPARPDRGRARVIFEQVRAAPKRVVFAEGEEEKTIRAALPVRNAGYGTPVLIGREDRIQATMAAMGPQRRRRARNPQCAAVAAQPQLHRFPVCAPAAPRLPVPRLPAHGEPGPQRLRRLHGGRGDAERW